MTPRTLRLLIALGGLAPGAAVAAEFRLLGEQLWFQAENLPLAEALQPFAQAGVRVRMDPAVTTRVTADVRGENAQAALARMLEPLGYVLTWDVVQGPLGPWPRLAEIQVFQPGRREQAQLLPGQSDNLDVARDADGNLLVRDEILLAFQPGSRREEVERLLAPYGGVLLGGISELGIYRVRFPPGSNITSLVEHLGRHPLVKAAEPHHAVALPPPAVSASAAGAAAAPAARGSVPVDAAPVAILDTGLLKESGLSALVAGRYDALNPDRAVDDRQGHGTQMALIASGAVLPAGAAESADGVPVLAIRAFDDHGYASAFSLMNSMVYAATNGARVLNMSWGTPVDSRFLASAIAWAQSREIVVVASAGNEPTGKPVYPAALPGVVAVSALDASGEPWDMSNFGRFVSVSAPGTASLPVGYRGPPGGYAGTSIASVYVARSLALYRARHPGATARQTVAALRQAVAPGAGGAQDPRLGYGRLDAAALGRLLP
ncbi:MAG: S8 family serine peptidase [Kiritimatiellae bacterium]|nr:S8 family serine peptidase [Kiritimatiellia bacterium]